MSDDNLDSGVASFGKKRGQLDLAEVWKQMGKNSPGIDVKVKDGLMIDFSDLSQVSYIYAEGVRVEAEGQIRASHERPSESTRERRERYLRNPDRERYPFGVPNPDGPIANDSGYLLSVYGAKKAGNGAVIVVPRNRLLAVFANIHEWIDDFPALYGRVSKARALKSLKEVTKFVVRSNRKRVVKKAGETVSGTVGLLGKVGSLL